MIVRHVTSTMNSRPQGRHFRPISDVRLHAASPNREPLDFSIGRNTYDGVHISVSITYLKTQFGRCNSATCSVISMLPNQMNHGQKYVGSVLAVVTVLRRHMTMGIERKTPEKNVLIDECIFTYPCYLFFFLQLVSYTWNRLCESKRISRTLSIISLSV